jgi:hypothetical protein
MSDDLEIAVANQNCIEVGLTDGGVIRIIQSNWPDDDVEILLQPHNASALCVAILTLADVCPYRFCDEFCAASANSNAPSVSASPAPVPETGRVIPMERGIKAGAKDPTAAERKRRQRERDRQRDGERDATVTVRDEFPLLPEPTS